MNLSTYPNCRSVTDVLRHWPLPRPLSTRPAPFQPCGIAMADTHMVMLGASGNDLCAADVVSLCKPKHKGIKP